MKRLKRGKIAIFVEEGNDAWYITVGRLAVCNHHAPPHIHAHHDRRHPGHKASVPVNPGLTQAEILERVGRLCKELAREPGLEELREALR